MSAPLFTAAEIARVLGTSPQAVRQRLAGVTPAGRKASDGRTAAAWTVNNFPQALVKDMERLRVAPDGTELFRSIAAMLGGVREPFSIGALDDDSEKQAREKMIVLAPLLARHARNGQPLAELARKARGHLANEHGILPALRTIEGWMKVALERDGNRCEFRRIDLYACTPEPKKTAAFGMQFPHADAAIHNWVQFAGNRHDCSRVWHCAFLDFEHNVNAGFAVNAVRRELLARLCMKGAPCYPVAPGNMRQTFNARLARWTDGGREPEALAADNRAENGRDKAFHLTKEETKAIRLEALKRNSVAMGIEWFVNDPACSPETRELINEYLATARREKKKVRWPLSIRRAATFTTEEAAIFRGRKQAQQFEQVDRRGAFYMDEHGAECPTFPNAIFESDDMSLNEPFRHTSADTGEIAIGRQMLCTIDVHSCNWLSGHPVARVRDAYRAEDIADHMLRTVEEHGLPLAWRLERGIWEGQVIYGIELKDGSKWGGLEKLFQIITVFKSKSKGTIEGSFNLLQRMLAHESTHIGRERGEFERATKLMAKAQRGDAEAASHFWHISEAADGVAKAMHMFNHRPKERRAHGKDLVVSAELYATAEKRELKAEDRWLFSPVKREITVRGGMIEMTVAHYPYPFRFVINGVVDGLHISPGQRVLVAFHPGRPEDGCHVFNGEPEGPRNREGWSIGERLMLAPMAPDAPQFSLSPHEKSLQRRKNAAAAVRTEFRTPTRAGIAGTRHSETRDGEGNRVEVGVPQRGGTPVMPGGRANASEADSIINSAVKNTRGIKPTAADTEDDDLAAIEQMERDERALIERSPWLFTPKGAL